MFWSKKVVSTQWVFLLTFLFSEASPAVMINYQLKLLHIAATLHLEHSGFAHTPTSLPAVLFPSSSSTPSLLQSSLRDTLQVLVGGRIEVLRTRVDTVYGWTLGKGHKFTLASQTQPQLLLDLK